jgi:hypothetical protein
MIELVKYFRILFLSPKISRERLKLFCEDHIQRLTANNPGGIFTTILTAVTNDYNAFFGDVASKSLNLSVQEGLTAAMEQSRAALVKNIKDNEGLIKFTYLNNVAFYLQFYPNGISEYTRADLSTLETIAERYRQHFVTHVADFPPPVIAAYNTMRTTFLANRTAQLNAMGTVSGEISDLATTKPALAKQLTVNLLTIALEYLGDESKAAVYFNQAIIDAAFKETDRRVTNEINPNEIQNAFDNVTTGDQNITIKNEGETDLVAGFVSAVNIAPVLLIVPSGIEITKNAAEIGWTTTNKFFNISNGTGIAGKYTASR